MKKTREIHPFFRDASNQVFLNPNKTAFIVDGPIGVGKSSNFGMYTAYDLSQCVRPIRKQNKWVRESKWLAIRESEESSRGTIIQLLGESIFSPEVMAMQDSPVKIVGKHPTRIVVSHKLPDDTHLEMNIECHGFNNPGAHDRLRTHEFMGALIFELQGIPWNIFEVAIQRCGRFRTQDLVIEKVIDGKKYTLSGLTQTAVVLGDINIPDRPHPVYERYYDVNDKSNLPYMFMTPPSPLIYKSVNQVKSKDALKKYPVTRFEGEDVVWLPNPDAYLMTKHFESKDSDGNNIPWSGYNYWYSNLHLTDSDIRRYIMGRPDTLGGDSAVYQTFIRDDDTVRDIPIREHVDVYAGFDPGGHASIEVVQETENGGVYFFKEFYFEPSDRVSTRQIFSDFFLPWCVETLQGHKVIIVPDPASSWLGKSIMMAQTESVITVMTDEINRFSNRGVVFEIQPCRTQNQDVNGRINSLGYFIDKGKFISHPDNDMLVSGLLGGYAKKKTKSGTVSDVIDKDSVYSHSVEAGQYACVNLLHKIKRGTTSGKRNNPFGKIKRTR